MLFALMFGLMSSVGYKVEHGAATIYYPKDGHCGTHKADGTKFTKSDSHIAHRKLPIGTPGIMCNLRTGLCTKTVVRDRGPWGSVIPCNKFVSSNHKGGIGKPRKSVWRGKCYWWQAQIRLAPGWERRGKFDITRPVARAMKHRAFDKVIFVYR